MISVKLLIYLILISYANGKAISSQNVAIHRAHDASSHFAEKNPQFVDPNPIKLVQNCQLDLKLDCTLKNPNAAFTVKWFKGNDVIQPDEDSRVKFIDSGFTLIIKASKIEDSANYSCDVFSNGLNKINKTFQVEVFPPPPMLRKDLPGNFTVVKGSNLTLECDVLNKEFDFWEIIWLKHFPNTQNRMKDENGNLLYTKVKNCGQDGTCLVHGEDISGRKTYTIPPDEILILNIYDIEESGWYSCAINSRFGTDLNSGYIEVVERLPENPAVLEERQRNSYIMSASASIIFAFIIALVASISGIIICNRKAKSERKRRCETDEHAKKVIVLAKQVMVELNRETNGMSEKSSLLFPHVTIRSEPKSLLQICGKGNETSINCEYIFEIDQNWEFNRNQLSFKSLLGEGAFGLVRLAEAHGLHDLPSPTLVAVKMLKQGHTDQDVIDFVSEVEVMKIIGKHENIINLLGICASPPGEPLYAIVEYAPFGNLKDYLIARRPPELKQKKRDPDVFSTNSMMLPLHPDIRYNQLQLSDQLSMAWQVAKGMQFLSMHHYVHRDLAARNILVCKNNVYKIADFGLTRDIHDNDYYRKETTGKLPLKWMAPEAIRDRIYTTQSDVWSYGILVWEIMTFGENPFHNINPEIFFELLINGSRLYQPQGCPNEIYNLMLQTWKIDPKQRPSWGQLVEDTHKLLAKFQPTEYLILPAEMEGCDYLSPTHLTPPLTPANIDDQCPPEIFILK